MTCDSKAKIKVNIPAVLDWPKSVFEEIEGLKAYSEIQKRKKFVKVKSL